MSHKRRIKSPDGALQIITRRTLAHYNQHAREFRVGTDDHDVSQNIDALLAAMTRPPPCRILDFGCGPGRDLMRFSELGHQPVGLDGSAEFVAMARQRVACEVWLQDFLDLDLPPSRFDGVFANASLFHVPQQALPDVLCALWKTLDSDGVLFASNPRGDNREGWNGSRYGCYHDRRQWRGYVEAAGFVELHHYYRPAGKPRDQQPWLATLWRKTNAD